ncbi:uncharacterized protein [Centruroides vittatus]|uniref:uncharacterized protein n=1 Tax=Centruroides vittatus TaxID=120091 RepID=UPI00350F186D
MEGVRPTHETEFAGVAHLVPSYWNPPDHPRPEDGTDPIVFAVSAGCVVATAALLAVLVWVFRRRTREKEGRLATRARLFSRDRLTTSEYKNTLASLDRKLAMDEILEKKRAILAPSDDPKTNQYVDEVFVDLTASNFVDVEETRLLKDNC